MARDETLWPFSSTSPWNMPIGSGATYADDPNVREGYGINSDNGYSHPIFFAAESDPLNSVRTDTSAQFGNGATREFRIPAGAVEASGSDHHMHVIEPSTGGVAPRYVWEGIGCARQTVSSWNYYRLERNDLFGEGWFAGGTRAIGGSAIGGLIRKHEAAANYIPHTLAIAMSTTQLSATHIWPATEHDDQSTPSTGDIPEGALFAIPASVDVTALGLSPGGLAVAHALQDYGAYVTDRNFSGTVFYVEPGASSTFNNDFLNDRFVLVDLLQRVTNSDETNPGGPGTRRVALAPEFDGTTPPTTGASARVAWASMVLPNPTLTGASVRMSWSSMQLPVPSSAVTGAFAVSVIAGISFTGSPRIPGSFNLNVASLVRFTPRPPLAPPGTFNVQTIAGISFTGVGHTAPVTERQMFPSVTKGRPGRAYTSGRAL